MRFSEPVSLPSGQSIATLRDAGAYIERLPKAKQTHPDWQHCIELLIRTVDATDQSARAWEQFARIGLMRALNGPPPIPELDPSKRNHWRMAMR